MNTATYHNILHRHGLRQLIILVLLCLPLTIGAAETWEIRSQSDWDRLESQCDGKEVNVTLYCDVTFNTKGYGMNLFTGTLDGRGHSFIIDYKDEFSHSAPFKALSGKVQNLYIKGTIEFRYGSTAYTESVPLAYGTKNNVEIVNCHTNVTFREMSDGQVWFGNNTCLGGFLSETTDNSNVNFKDCSSKCEFLKNKVTWDMWYDTGGFVGVRRSESKVKFTNCFSYLTFQTGMSSKRSGYFVGYGDEEAKADNCYGYSNQTDLNNWDDHGVATNAQLASGEIAYKLRAGRTGSNCPWGQSIGADAMPQLTLWSPTSREVYYCAGGTRQLAAGDATTLFYPANATFYIKSAPTTEITRMTKRVVTGYDKENNNVYVSGLKTENTANVPLLLYNEYGTAVIVISLPPAYYNKQEQTGLLRGVYATTPCQEGDYVYTDMGFKPATEPHEAWHCYLAGGTGEKIGFDDSHGDIFVISSKGDWNTFGATYGNGTTVSAYLACDLTLGDDDATVNRFYGTLNGQGHTITLNYNKKTQNHAVFNSIGGTVENLRITGTVAKGNNALANSTSRYVTFNDCYSTVGFIGTAYHPVTFNHCLSAVTTGQNWFVKRVETINGQGRIVNNTSYVYGPNNGSNKYDAQKMARDQLRSGETTCRLNDGRTGDQAVWMQTIGTDTVPQLRDSSPQSKEVFYTTGETRAASSERWTSVYYPVSLSLPEGVKQYVEKTLTGDTLYVYEALTDYVPANTPTLLYAADGMPELKLPAQYYNESPASEEGYLHGTSTVMAADDGIRALTATTEPLAQFGKTADAVSGGHCYLVADDYDKYYITIAAVAIKSIDDWNTFKKRYSGQPVTACLLTDLTMTEADAGMKSFIGSFDGMGHTLTLHFDDAANVAPFLAAEGTIRNLKTDGTIVRSSRSSAATPLVLAMEGKGKTLNIENCHSCVNTTTSTTGSEKFDYCSTLGGFVGTVGEDDATGNTLNFKDCSYTGTTTLPGDVEYYGGFVGVMHSGNTVTLTNCFSDLSGNNISKASEENLVDYFVGRNSGTLTSANCYTRKAAIYKGGRDYNNDAKATVITDEEVADGRATYLLNEGRMGDSCVWLQTIGTDDVPQLALFADCSMEVFETIGDYTVGTNGWGTLYYPAAVTMADGVKAYIVSGVEEMTVDGETENYLVLAEVPDGVVAAYTPVIVCSLTDGETQTAERTIPLKPAWYNKTNPNVDTPSTTVMLQGVLERTQAMDGWYILQKNNGVTAFYQVDTSVAQPSIPAFRCALLWVPKEYEQSSAKVNLYFDDEDTGISTVLEPMLRDGAVYDLQGRKVQTLQNNQIYIKNGRKFIVR